jgi:adenylate cyclase
MATRSFLSELKRRKVYNVAVVYAAIAWLLLQFADVTFEPLGLPQWSINFLLALAALGFPIAIVLAWMFDLTADGIKRTEFKVAPLKYSSVSISRIVKFALIAILVLTVGYLYMDKLLRQEVDDQVVGMKSEEFTMPQAERLGSSIVVIAFENIGGDATKKYFSDGLTIDTITALTRFQNLFVRSADSAFNDKGKAIDIKLLGRELGVRYILQGSVQREADKIRVSAQLLDAGTMTNIWAETYDRDLTVENIFSVQDDIAHQVAGTVGDASGIISRTENMDLGRKGTQTLNAYDCVLLAYAYTYIHSVDAHLRARVCLEQAIEQDKDYADSWAHLALLYREAFYHGYNERPDALERAVNTALHAVELDTNNQMAHAALALTHYDRRELDEFFAEAEKAIALNPNNSIVIGGLAMFISFAGQPERGVQLTRDAARLNPFHADWLYTTLASDYYRQGKYEQALVEARKVHVPSDKITHINLIAIYGQLGRNKEAKRHIVELEQLIPGFSANARDELHKSIVSEKLIEHYLEGLSKAGLFVQSDPSDSKHHGHRSQ